MVGHLKTMTKLKPKHKAFAKEYVLNGGNATQAVKKVLKKKDDNVSAVTGARMLRNAKIQQEIANVSKSLADMIPDELITKRHIELLNKRDNIVIEGEVIDNGIETQAVSKGLEMAYKLKGAYAPEKSLNVNVEVNTENREKMIILAKEIASKLISDEIK